ncbi:MAG: hypothetical protein R2764_25900 [Bacteroidales bacterium]
MKVLLKISILLIGLFWQLFTSAQTEAFSRLDTNAILVGDQINLELTFSCPADYSVQWPNLNDTIISEIEILSKSKIDTTYSKDNNGMLLRQVLRITSFDSGYYAIPPFRFNWKQSGDQLAHFTETDALLLEVSTIPVDTEKEIMDIKDPIEAPYTFREALPWIIGLLLAISIGYLVFYYLKKRKKSEPVFKAAPKPKLPPHQIALDALDNLRHKKLWQSGLLKDYHTELTDILRDYIEGKFQKHAPEMTTDEIMEVIDRTATNVQAREKLRQTLILADLVKFAKEQPLPLENDGSLNNAIDFVKETIHLSPADEVTNSIFQEKVTSESSVLRASKSDVKNEDGKEVKDVQ